MKAGHLAERIGPWRVTMSTNVAAHPAQGHRSWKPAAPILAVAALVAIGVAVVAAALAQPRITPPAGAGGLNPMQVVIKGEAADRAAAAALTGHQVVIQGEIHDRTTGLGGQQVEFPGSHADRGFGRGAQVEFPGSHADRGFGRRAQVAL